MTWDLGSRRGSRTVVKRDVGRRSPRPSPHSTRAPLVFGAARFGTRERSRAHALVSPALAPRPSPGPRRIARFVKPYPKVNGTRSPWRSRAVYLRVRLYEPSDAPGSGRRARSERGRDERVCARTLAGPETCGAEDERSARGVWGRAGRTPPDVTFHDGSRTATRSQIPRHPCHQ